MTRNKNIQPQTREKNTLDPSTAPIRKNLEKKQKKKEKKKQEVRFKT